MIIRVNHTKSIEIETDLVEEALNIYWNIIEGDEDYEIFEDDEERTDYEIFEDDEEGADDETI